MFNGFTIFKQAIIISIAMSENSFFNKVIGYISLETELETFDNVHDEIVKGVVFKGTNLWILIFAIVIASVGLNMNSTAVIIGAMLISPLMGPINGMGYSIATFDLDLFRKSIKSFSFAVFSSLIASTTYFALSPVSTAYSELLARTSPTIYDVLIALFGGLAGIVAISSKKKGNVIPGVAIATALMPPLCTAGYGLATAQFSFFFGAIYLFAINTIFIALASVWVSQYLKFPIRGNIDEKKKGIINRAITAVITLVLLPSIYFGYKLVQQEKFTVKANQYISNVSLFEGNYLLKNTINAEKQRITLIYGGSELTDKQKKLITDKAQDFGITETEIIIEQGLAFSDFDSKNTELLKLKEDINLLTNSLIIAESQRDSLIRFQTFGKRIFEEIKAINPLVSGCLYSKSPYYTDSSETALYQDIVVISSEKEKLQPKDLKTISKWLKKRLESDSVRVIYDFADITKPLQKQPVL
jgi:uncharacterized hydrophobic protein (TIGR00271 family)